MRWVWAVLAIAITMLVVMAWVMNDMDVQTNQTTVKNGKISDWYPEKEGLVLTVATDSGFYKLYTNATMINVKEPIAVVFQGNKPIAILQDDRAFGVKDWEKLKNLEDMPEVKER